MHEIKWGNGKFDKYKVRLVVLGHPGNVQLGIRWWGSKYVATPSLDLATIKSVIQFDKVKLHGWMDMKNSLYTSGIISNSYSIEAKDRG